MRLDAKPLSSSHLKELQNLVDRGRELIVTGDDALDCLERVLEDVKRGESSREALSLVAFVWADEVIAKAKWRWVSLSPDGRLNPAIVSPDKAHACVPIDLVLSMVEAVSDETLRSMFEKICGGGLPPSPAGTLAIVG